MSYFDDNFTGGAKSDDEDENTVNDSGSETEDENEIVEDENEVAEEENEVDLDDEDLEEEEEEEDEGEGKGYDNDVDVDSDNEGEKGEKDEEGESNPKRSIKKIIKKNVINKAFIDNLSDDDDEDDGETYLKKFDKDINDNYIVNNHPECALQNYDEILAMTRVVRDKNNIIIDDFHKTIPHLTKYERARILGQRAKQIESGATPFIKVPEDVIDGYLIAVLELNQGRIPFIIRRPMPNGGSEYWKINDLENIAF